MYKKRLLFLTIWLGLLIVSLTMMIPQQTQADGPDEAKIIVQFNDTETIVRTINFTAPISGLTALELTGLNVVITNTQFGAAICSIEGVGCPADECFTCNPDGKFWGYNYWDGNNWQSYQTGVSGSIISQTGAVEGFRWGQFGDPVRSAGPVLASQRGFEWLKQQQQADGGYGSTGATSEALIALGANQINPNQWRLTPADSSILSYMLTNGPAFANTQLAGAGKLAVSLSGVNGAWPVGAKQPLDYTASRSFSSAAGPQAWAILGTVALSQSLPATAVSDLIGLANEDGGWGWFKDETSDTNATALAIQALIAAGQSADSAAVVNGLAYLKSTQNQDGGFPYASSDNDESDTNSTSYAVQAIVATGQDPLTGTWVINNNSPISFLQARQRADGSFAWMATNEGNILFSTQQAIPALLYRSLPLKTQSLPNVGLAVETQANVSQAKMGDMITYTYYLTNTGELAITNLSAEDDQAGVISLLQTSLSPGESTMARLTYTVTLTNTQTALTNTVTAKGTVTTLDDDIKAQATNVVSLGVPGKNYLPLVIKQ